MDISLSYQAFMFLAMTVCGGVCGLVFDVFRAIRRIHKSPVGVVAIQDIVFWIIELTLVYMVAFKLNYAKVRAYEAVALIVGSFIYFMTASGYVISFFCSVFEVLIKWLNILMTPLEKLFSFAKITNKWCRKGVCKAKNKIYGCFSSIPIDKWMEKTKKCFQKKTKNCKKILYK